MSVPENRSKVALVTGAARRIGAVIARTLHAQDFDVAIHYRASADDAEKLVAELNASRANSAAAFAADLTDIAAIERLAGQVIGWHGRLDVLVNNASSFYPTPVGTITEAQWDDLVGTNLKAPLFLSQAVLPGLRDAGGVIVNIVDVHSTHPLREHPVAGQRPRTGCARQRRFAGGNPVAGEWHLGRRQGDDPEASAASAARQPRGHRRRGAVSRS